MMKFSIAVPIVAIVLAATAALSWADGKTGHVCFNALDADKDGVVTYQEFAEVYGEEQDRYNAADLDKDGALTHDEYHDLLGHGS